MDESIILYIVVKTMYYLSFPPLMLFPFVFWMDERRIDLFSAIVIQIAEGEVPWYTDTTACSLMFAVRCGLRIISEEM